MIRIIQFPAEFEFKDEQLEALGLDTDAEAQTRDIAVRADRIEMMMPSSFDEDPLGSVTRIYTFSGESFISTLPYDEALALWHISLPHEAELLR